MVKKQPVSKWSDGTTPLEELPAPEQLAHQIVIERGDVISSVTRIMEAGYTPSAHFMRRCLISMTQTAILA